MLLEFKIFLGHPAMVSVPTFKLRNGKNKCGRELGLRKVRQNFSQDVNAMFFTCTAPSAIAGTHTFKKTFLFGVPLATFYSFKVCKIMEHN